jgi:hypothetical protein
MMTIQCWHQKWGKIGAKNPYLDAREFHWSTVLGHDEGTSVEVIKNRAILEEFDGLGTIIGDFGYKLQILDRVDAAGGVDDFDGETFDALQRVGKRQSGDSGDKDEGESHSPGNMNM